jgi:hypothetical protein
MSPGTGAAHSLNTLLRKLLWTKSFVKGERGGGRCLAFALKPRKIAETSGGLPTSKILDLNLPLTL